MEVVSRWAVVRARFPAVHHWKGASGVANSHLAHPHRHEFHVTVKVEQFHNDRDVEYLELKRVVLRASPKDPLDLGAPDIGGTSCEMLCEDFFYAVERAGFADGRRVVVSVFEDGENGAEVEFGAGGPGKDR